MAITRGFIAPVTPYHAAGHALRPLDCYVLLHCFLLKGLLHLTGNLAAVGPATFCLAGHIYALLSCAAAQLVAEACCWCLLMLCACERLLYMAG